MPEFGGAGTRSKTICQVLFGTDGTSPYRVMTESNAALSGGPPAFTTAATS